MAFEVKNKVALVTGGASGIGLSIVKQLLKLGVKGVVIADVSSENGEESSKKLKNEFGTDRVVFVRTDIADSTSFENAFKATLQHFKSIDILVNNAGICRDDMWEKQIDINLKGTTNGMILGLEKYLKDHKQGDEAVILNLASLAAVLPAPMMPVYAATKSAIVGLTKSWGVPCHFERTKVRVTVLCPAMTDTDILKDFNQHFLNADYAKIMESVLAGIKALSPDAVAEEAVPILEKASNGSIWLKEDARPAYEYIMPDINDFKNNVLK